MNRPRKRWLKPSEVATLLSVHPATVYRWVLSGKLRARVRAGTRYAIRRRDALALLRPVTRRQAPAPVPTDRARRLRERYADEVLKAAGFRE